MTTPPSSPRLSHPIVDDATKEAVRAEITSVGPALEQATAHHSYNALDGVVPALEQAADIETDLAFRLLLRALKAYSVPISEARYERYLALGDELGLGEDVVDDTDFTIWPDLMD